MRLALLLLGGCGVLLPPAMGPSRALTGAEQALAARAAASWQHLGLPELRCSNDADLQIVKLEGEAFHRACGRPGPCTPDGPRPCANSCYNAGRGGWMFGAAKPYLVIHTQRPHCFWVHELLHRFEGCSGLGYDYSHSRPHWKALLPALSDACSSISR